MLGYTAQVGLILGARMPQGEEQLYGAMRSLVHSRGGNERAALQDDLKHIELLVLRNYLCIDRFRESLFDRE